MTNRAIEAPDEIVITPLNKESSTYARDALAKAVYTRLFTWLVARLNQSLSPTENVPKSSVLGILDIYGFEVFQKNRYKIITTIDLMSKTINQFALSTMVTPFQTHYL